MSECKWSTDQQSGAEYLMLDGVEKVRISDARNMRNDEGRSGSSTITVDGLRTQLEAIFCNKNNI